MGWVGLDWGGWVGWVGWFGLGLVWFIHSRLVLNVAKNNLNFLLLLPPDCWDYRCVTSCLVYQTEH